MAISVPLISSGELAARLRDEDLLVCDCRFAGDAEASRVQYLSGHVPGAIHVYWLEDLSAADSAVTTFLPNAEEAAARLGRLGITQGKNVVAYSDAETFTRHGCGTSLRSTATSVWRCSTAV